MSVTEMVCDAPPAVSVSEEVPRLTEMAGAGETVKLKVAVAGLTPLPLAVTVIVWSVTRVAPAEATSRIWPVFPVPGSVVVAVTPVGSPDTLNVTAPV